MAAWLSRLVAVALLMLLPDARVAGQGAQRVQRLNQAFLEHVAGLPGAAIRAAVLRESLRSDDDEQTAEGFVPDALAVLYPPFERALRAFDAERYAEVLDLLEPLCQHADPYLAANAGYFYARAQIERGRTEEAAAFLHAANAPEKRSASYSPYAPHMHFLEAHCHWSNLRFDEAARALRALETGFGDAPAPVRVGARQLLLEIERRERGTLDEVSGLMSYAADRLKFADAAEPVRDRQQEAVALLDKLIEDAREDEQQHQGTGGAGRGHGRRGRGPPAAPRGGAEESTAPGGSGRIGDLHGTGPAAPGEMWGKLPPMEREKVLQSLREKFPSRYRELVEQYYRSLAEQK